MLRIKVLKDNRHSGLKGIAIVMKNVLEGDEVDIWVGDEDMGIGNLSTVRPRFAVRGRDSQSAAWLQDFVIRLDYYEASPGRCPILAQIATAGFKVAWTGQEVNRREWWYQAGGTR